MSGDKGVLISTTTNSNGATILIREMVGLLASDSGDVGTSRLLVIAFAGTTTTRVHSHVRGHVRRRYHGFPRGSSLLHRGRLLNGTGVYAVSSFYVSLIHRGFSGLSVSPSFGVASKMALGRVSRGVVCKVIGHCVGRGGRTFGELISLINNRFSRGGLYRLFLSMCRFSHRLPFPGV